MIGWARSTNSGSTFTQRNCPGNGIPCNEPVLFYAPIALGPGNPNTFYFGTDRLWRSTDGLVVTAASQKPLATDSVPPAAPVNQVLTTIAISPQNDNVRLVGLRNAKVFATTTGSSTLTDVTSPSFPPPNPGTIRRAVSRAMFLPNNQQTAYITFGGYNVPDGQHVWKTTNLDTSAGAPSVAWTPTGSGIPDVPVNCMVIDRFAPNNLYVGTDIGVYRSNDAGASWAPFSNGLPRIAIFDIAFQEQIGTSSPERVLRIATHGRGIWEIAVPTPPQVAGAVSRKLHNGTPFDIDLPLAGNPGIECRTGPSAGEHSIVFTFTTNIASVSNADVTTGTGEVNQATTGPGPGLNQYTVNLTGVTNAQSIVVTLNGVQDTAGGIADVQANTSADGVVNSADVTQTRRQSGQVTIESNKRIDLSTDGVINSADITLARRASGSALP